MLPFIACQPHKNLDEFSFLTGKWQAERDGMLLQQIWNKTNADTISGDGIVLSDKDSLYHEKIAIKILKGDFVYVTSLPNVKGSVLYKLISSGKNTWTFENKERDFPQQIAYTYHPPDSIIAVLEGVDKGKQSHEEFHLKKIN